MPETEPMQDQSEGPGGGSGTGGTAEKGYTLIESHPLSSGWWTENTHGQVAPPGGG